MNPTIVVQRTGITGSDPSISVILKRLGWCSLVGVYLVALGLPAVRQAGFGAPTSGLPDSVRWGFECAFSLPMAALSPGWWANPMWFGGIVALIFGHVRWALLCGSISSILALLVLVIGPFPPDRFEFTDFQSGYFVWLASMLGLLTFALFQHPIDPESKIPAAGNLSRDLS